MRRDYDFVNVVSFEREKKGITQLDLAKIVGISRSELALLEKNKIGCSACVAACICEALNLTFEELFFKVRKR